ncbi:hypothetical protein PIB30_021645 [Stylosanthes scabra]|uniref:Cytochrome b561 domain-containing protein n=1 Tax=Stylosanthes scabra TaxID=79078 RepID=A0ABU6XAC1_9FABA|nr:hypothetical protein [Stylosanthes scabra]
MRSSSTLALAQLFGFLGLILLLVWLLHYRGGIEYDSENPDRVFNVHPFMMYFGFIFLVGQAIMTHHVATIEPTTRKTIHAMLHLIAIVLGIVGICAVFKYHDMINLVDVYSLHSWIGLGTFCLFGIQWLFGLMFMFGGRETRVGMSPWHIAGGRALLYMAICAAMTGFMNRYAMLKLLPHERETHLINFTALAILLFGVFVDISVGLAHYGH